MLAAVDVVKALKQVGINAVHIKMRARGGVETKTQVLKLLLELWQETDIKLAGLRMSLPFPPIQPEEMVVAEVEDSEAL